MIGDVGYCECPEETAWNESECGACPVVDASEQDAQMIELGDRELRGADHRRGRAPPKSEYDDANLWLENAQTGDRVLLGNTHDACSPSA